MYIVKAFSRFFVLLFEPILVAYLAYSGAIVTYLVSCFLVTEFLAFGETWARIAIPQAFVPTAGSNFAIRHSTILNATFAKGTGKPIQSFHEISKFEILSYMLYPIFIFVGLDKPLQLFCRLRNA
jgi:hypothetical protein